MFSVLSLIVSTKSVADDFYVFFTTAPNAAFLSTGVVVTISVVITFIVSVVIGFIAGFITSTLCSRKKAVYSPTVKGQANIGPTAPAGPVYEEVSHKEEIELNTNKAYGQVRL